jgi:small subunit ribosomal protein S21
LPRALREPVSSRAPFDPKGNILQVLVRDNNIDQALRFLKKKMQREGVFREMKQRRFYEKPSERTNREKAEAIRRARKVARKKLQREGLLPDPRKDKDKAGAGKPPWQRPAFGSRPPQAPRQERTEPDPASKTA